MSGVLGVKCTHHLRLEPVLVPGPCTPEDVTPVTPEGTVHPVPDEEGHDFGETD